VKEAAVVPPRRPAGFWALFPLPEAFGRPSRGNPSMSRLVLWFGGAGQGEPGSLPQRQPQSEREPAILTWRGSFISVHLERVHITLQIPQDDRLSILWARRWGFRLAGWKEGRESRLAKEGVWEATVPANGGATRRAFHPGIKGTLFFRG
jgi:hypothetical protein